MDAVFGPDPADGSLDWLLHCLAQDQMARVIVMLERNAEEHEEENRASYYQRMQRILRYMKAQDDDWQMYIDAARKLP